MVTKGLGFTWQRASAANAVFSDVDTPQKVEADTIVDDETSVTTLHVVMSHFYTHVDSSIIMSMSIFRFTI